VLDELASLRPLAGYVQIETTTDSVRFVGANVFVQDGTGFTDDGNPPNGRGNLIVGYDEYSGGDHKTGSHNLVVGIGHDYPGRGSVVFGADNSVGAEASVLGGILNRAADRGVVVGGVNNVAIAASVLGGDSNEAQGVLSSVVGGKDNIAAGEGAVVLGGRENQATSDYDIVP
jgi:hypothetical protein